MAIGDSFRLRQQIVRRFQNNTWIASSKYNDNACYQFMQGAANNYARHFSNLGEDQIRERHRCVL